MSATALTLTTPFGGAAAPVLSSDFSKTLKKLYENALEVSMGAAAAALAAVHALWRWLMAFLARIARALGLRASGPAELTDQQAAGNASTTVDVEQKTDANGQPVPAAGGLPADAAASALFAEANRMMDHLVKEGTMPAELADSGNAMAMVEFYLARLGRFRTVFLDHEVELEAKIAPRLAELAKAQKTTPGLVRSMLEGASEASDLIDGRGELMALFKEVHDTRLSWARIESVAKSLVDASAAQPDVPGLYVYAETQFKSLFPGATYEHQDPPGEAPAEGLGLSDEGEAKGLDRKDPGVAGDAVRPPEGVVSQASGESTTVVGDDLDTVLVDAPNRNNSAGTSLHALKPAFTSSVSRNTLATNSNTAIQSPKVHFVTQVASKTAEGAGPEIGDNLGSAQVSAQVTDVEKKAAFASPFSQFVGRRPSFDEDFEEEGSGALEQPNREGALRPAS